MISFTGPTGAEDAMPYNGAFFPLLTFLLANSLIAFLRSMMMGAACSHEGTHKRKMSNVSVLKYWALCSIDVELRVRMHSELHDVNTVLRKLTKREDGAVRLKIPSAIKANPAFFLGEVHVEDVDARVRAIADEDLPHRA